jgi:hypothetical protein
MSQGMENPNRPVGPETDGENLTNAEPALTHLEIRKPLPSALIYLLEAAELEEEIARQQMNQQRVDEDKRIKQRGNQRRRWAVQAVQCIIGAQTGHRIDTDAIWRGFTITIPDDITLGRGTDNEGVKITLYNAHLSNIAIQLNVDLSLEPASVVSAENGHSDWMVHEPSWSKSSDGTEIHWYAGNWYGVRDFPAAMLMAKRKGEERDKTIAEQVRAGAKVRRLDL